MKLRWLPVALDQAHDVIDQIASDRPLVAEKWTIGLFELVEKLRRSPLRGRVVPEVERDEIRELRYGKYRIVYRFDPPAEISILTIRHGSRRFDTADVPD